MTRRHHPARRHGSSPPAGVHNCRSMSGANFVWSAGATRVVGRPEEEGRYTVCLAGTRGHQVCATLSPAARLTWTIEAETYFKAMTLPNEYMGCDRYTTNQAWARRAYAERGWSRVFQRTRHAACRLGCSFAGVFAQRVGAHQPALPSVTQAVAPPSPCLGRRRRTWSRGRTRRLAPTVRGSGLTRCRPRWSRRVPDRAHASEDVERSVGGRAGRVGHWAGLALWSRAPWCCQVDTGRCTSNSSRTNVASKEPSYRRNSSTRAAATRMSSCRPASSGMCRVSALIAPMVR